MTLLHNIRGFVTVSGFFIGVLFSIVMVANPIELVVNSILFTMGFYSFANLFSAFYIKHLEDKSADIFPKKYLEEELDKMIEELEKKENKFMPQKENYNTIINKQIDKIEESQ